MLVRSAPLLAFGQRPLTLTGVESEPSCGFSGFPRWPSLEPFVAMATDDNGISDRALVVKEASLKGTRFFRPEAGANRPRFLAAGARQ